jgi:hypothetical protein
MCHSLGYVIPRNLVPSEHQTGSKQDYHENDVAQASKPAFADKMSALHFHHDRVPKAGMTILPE